MIEYKLIRYFKATIFLKNMVIFTVFTFSLSSAADDIDYTSAQQCIKLSFNCNGLSIRGDFYKAIEAVYKQDFKNELKKNVAFNKNQDPRHFLDLTKLENFDFAVQKDDTENKYYVGVAPHVSKDGPVFFGTTHYELDAKTLKILKKNNEK
jgi:hypothetical protein